MPTPRPFDIRVGDRWEFRSNNGTLMRTITDIGSRLMAYRDAAGNKRVCLISTFRRWWRVASLEFATDWDGRDSDP
jgi:hypothetical protein